MPFDEMRHEVLCLIEICTASLLKKEKLYLSYKGQSAAQKLNREFIWNEMQKRRTFQAAPDFRQAAIEDYEGDALDAVLAALCVQGALEHGSLTKAADATERCEGRVYF